MTSKQPIIPIIILNWNGSKDTIACLHSLYAMDYKDFFVVVVDNGSSDKSLDVISSWLNENNINNSLKKENETVNCKVSAGDCFIHALSKNYGFAKGNNFGLGLIRNQEYKYALFLNNDTIVEPDFLREMLDFKVANPEFKVLTPLIRYYSEKEKIWNAGGRIFFGMRKYYYADSVINDIKETNYIPITFVTGCALFVDQKLIENDKVFTERFFFGEEDFDFCLRMKKNKVLMACVLDANIYHKVSASTSHILHKGKVYLYYLNRFINIKLNYSSLFFTLWKYMYIPYIAKLLKSQGYRFSEINFFFKNLLKDSLKYNEVDERLFKSIIEKK